MANDIKEQMVIEVKDKSLFGLFSLQLDESTDISSAAQQMTFVGYVTEKKCERRAAFLQSIENHHKGKRCNGKG